MTQGHTVVVVDARSAARLAAEGAFRLDTDTGALTCGGCPAVLPVPGGAAVRPILVTGTCPAAVHAAAERLARRGLPAWEVADAAP